MAIGETRRELGLSRRWRGISKAQAKARPKSTPTAFILLCTNDIAPGQCLVLERRLLLLEFPQLAEKSVELLRTQLSLLLIKGSIRVFVSAGLLATLETPYSYNHPKSQISPVERQWWSAEVESALVQTLPRYTFL